VREDFVDYDVIKKRKSNVREWRSILKKEGEQVGIALTLGPKEKTNFSGR